MARFVPSLIFSFLVIGLSACSNSGSSSDGGSSSPVPPSESTAKTYRHFAYASAQYGNVVYSYSVDAQTGVMTELSTPSIAAQSLPMITAASYDKKFLLAANYSSHSVSCYSINSTTGDLTLVEHQALTAASAPGTVVSHPSKPIFYTANSGIAKISVLDITAAGDVSERTTVNAGAGVTALIINAAGTMMYSVDQNADQIGIYTIDANGDLSLAGTAAVPAGSQPNSATLSINENFLYTANWGTATISGFSVSGTTLTSLGAPVSGGTGGVYTVIASPDGEHLYAAKPYGNNYSEHTLDPNTGAIGAANEVAMPGAVNFTFLGNFALITSWTNNVAGIPLKTRSYSALNGVGSSDLSVTATSNRGLYKITVVTFENP